MGGAGSPSIVNGLGALHERSRDLARTGESSH